MNIDPNVINVVLGVVANGLTAIISGSYRKLVDSKSDYPKTKVSLDAALRRAIEKISDKIEWHGPPSVEELCLFLTSPEVEWVIRHLYAGQLLNQKSETLESVNEEFHNLYASYFDLEYDESKVAADEIFKILSRATETAMDIAVSYGDLKAHEAKSSLRFRVLQEDLLTLRKNVQFLTEQQKLDINAVNTFEERYRAQISSRHGRITPPNFDNAIKLPINSIYVAPKFIKAGSGNFERSEGSDIEQLIRYTYRIVILGNPGGGKTTFTHKLCFDFASRDLQYTPHKRHLTPIPITLREYGAEKRLHNHSILQFIESTANDTYQVSPPKGAMEYLLLNDRAVVIFDGLDELLETGYRQEIRDDIESFCSLYPSVPVIVTSREVGYEQAPLDAEKFETYRLASFNEEQVRAYVSKWFSVGTELSHAQQLQKSSDFLKESQIVSDLRSNPLMLGLMCNIYRGENYIPRNRPDVYRKCAEMLFERWDRSREIPITFHFEDDIRPTMAYLAHWIYSEPKLQEGVTERLLISEAAEYLLKYRFDDKDKAERAARDFIDFCRGRAWIFTEVGTDKYGDGLYQFTHRTFLEFFTAVYLVRTHETTEALVDKLLLRIKKREWDIVAQLAFQIKTRTSEGANDKLFLLLLEHEQAEGANEQWSILSFAARCLEFMEPSPKVIRDITTACLMRCILLGLERQEEKRALGPSTPAPQDHNPIDEVFGALLSTRGRNRETIAARLTELIIEYLGAEAISEALVATEVAFHIKKPLQLATGREIVEEQLQFWDAIPAQVIAQSRTQIVALCEKDFDLALDAYKRELIPIEYLISQYGIGSVFKYSILNTFTGIREISVAVDLIQNCIRVFYYSEKNETTEKLLDDLIYLGKVTLTATFPVMKSQEANYYPPLVKLITELPSVWGSKRMDLLSSDASFGIFVIYAIWSELRGALSKQLYSRDEGKWDALIPAIKERKVALLSHLSTLVLSRYIYFEAAFFTTEIELSGFNAEQADFVKRWASRKIDLVYIYT